MRLVLTSREENFGDFWAKLAPSCLKICNAKTCPLSLAQLPYYQHFRSKADRSLIILGFGDLPGSHIRALRPYNNEHLRLRVWATADHCTNHECNTMPFCTILCLFKAFGDPSGPAICGPMQSYAYNLLESSSFTTLKGSRVVIYQYASMSMGRRRYKLLFQKQGKRSDSNLLPDKVKW